MAKRTLWKLVQDIKDYPKNPVNLVSIEMSPGRGLQIDWDENGNVFYCEGGSMYKAHVEEMMPTRLKG